MTVPRRRLLALLILLVIGGADALRGWAQPAPTPAPSAYRILIIN